MTTSAMQGTSRRTARRVGAVVLGGVLLLGACTGGSADTASDDAGFDEASAMTEEAMAEAMTESESAAQDGDSAAPGETGEGGQGGIAPVSGADLAALAGRDVIRTASLVVESESVDRAVAEVERLTLVAGGFLGAVERRGGEDPTATMTLRVPGTEFTSTLSDLRGLGQVVLEQQNADDVTDQVVDVAARIGTAEASIERVRVLLDQAVAIGDVVALESELSRRVAELESLKGRQRVLQDQVSLATVNLEIRQPTEVVAIAGVEDETVLGFLTGLRSGWDALVDVTRVVGTIAGALLPFAVVLAILSAPLVVWRRRRTPVASAES